MKSRIQTRLRKALLAGADMSHALYKYELEEHIAYWKAGMIADRDEFLFVVTENRGDVAMLLMTNRNELFINSWLGRSSSSFGTTKEYMRAI